MLFVFIAVCIFALGLAVTFFEWAAREARTTPGLYLMGKVALVATGGWLMGMIFYPFYADYLPFKGVAVFFAALVAVVVFAPRRPAQ